MPVQQSYRGGFKYHLHDRYKVKHIPSLHSLPRRGTLLGRRTAASSETFVDAAWLRKNLEDVALLDSRVYDEYLAGHIPGAVHISWQQDCCDEEQQLQTDPDMFVPMLEKKGVTADRDVVVYDDMGAAEAAQVWWALKVHGHPHAKLLIGGMKAWLTQGGPTDLYEPCPLKLCSLYEADPQLQHAVKQEDMVDGVVFSVDESAAQQLHMACMRQDWTAVESLLDGMRAISFGGTSSARSTVAFVTAGSDCAPACLAAACWQQITGSTLWTVLQYL